MGWHDPVDAAEKLAHLILPPSLTSPIYTPDGGGPMRKAVGELFETGIRGGHRYAWQKPPRQTRSKRPGCRSDAAGYAMAGLTREQSLMVLVAWIGDMRYFGELERLTWQAVVSEAVAPQRWYQQVGYRGHGYWRRMALLALCELIFPQRCPACRGTGRVAIEGRFEAQNEYKPAPRKRFDRIQIRICPLCEGRRIVSYTGPLRARIVGMSRAHWYRWQERYLLFVKPIPISWHAEAEAHLSPRLARRA